MATANPATPSPLGNDCNPYEFLRAADVEQARQIAELKAAGTVTDQAIEEIRQESRRALSLAIANHRERIRAIAWRMLRTREAPPVDMQYEFLADKREDCTVLSLVSLIAAEVTANDYPHDLPFHPDAHELAEAISRNHRSALQIVKDRIRTRALPVRAGTGIPVACNDDPAVLAWCNDLEAVTPPRALCTTLADARAFVHAAGLNPLRQLAGELAPPSDQVPNLPAKEAPPDLEAPSQPLEPTGTPKDMEGDHRPTTAAPHCAHIVRKPDRRQQGEGLFIDLRKQGVSEREAIKKVHERFGAKGLSRSSLQRAWKEASHQRPPTALAQLSEAAAKNQI